MSEYRRDLVGWRNGSAMVDLREANHRLRVRIPPPPLTLIQTKINSTWKPKL